MDLEHWETPKGTKLTISKMTTTHIKHCLNMLQSGRPYLNNNTAYILRFKKELEQRPEKIINQTCGCGSKVIETDGKYINDMFYCNTCINNDFAECYDCEELTNKDHLNNVIGDYMVCNACFERYVSCDDCGVSIHEDDIESCSNCETNYCNDCYCNHDCNENENEREANTTLPTEKAKKGKVIKIDRLIGVELEAENGNRNCLFDTLDQDCGITEDGSLTDGSEVQTPPRSMLDFENLIIDTCQKMLDAGFDTGSDSCGTHVHIDFSQYRDNYKEFAKMFKVIYAIEPIIYACLEDERENNSYCQPLAKRYNFTDINLKMKDATILGRYYKDSAEAKMALDKHPQHSCSRRYNGLNLHSIVYRGTIEFRYHEGTLDANELINYVNMLLHIIEYSTKNYNANEILKLKRLAGKNKVKRFFKIFRIPKTLQKYIIKKIKQEHSDYLK